MFTSRNQVSAYIHIPMKGKSVRINTTKKMIAFLLTLVLLMVGVLCQQAGRLDVVVDLLNTTFELHHDPYDTRTIITSQDTRKEGLLHKLLIHSRDNILLKVELLTIDKEGYTLAHNDISDIRKNLVRPATNDAIESMQASSPDIYFFLIELKEKGLRRTTQIRKKLPPKVRLAFPSLPTPYERLIFGALGPFFEEFGQKMPKGFEIFPKPKPSPKGKGAARNPAKKATSVLKFDLNAEDRAGSPCESNPAEFVMTIVSNAGNLIEVYQEETYYF